ncbi:beta-mannosidase-like [Chrysoperla carnea]|uniref:beta-mannosidase-like n=1 Tax=Chrysoperla carnea TaxID=189513 RepID=UPI001D08B2E0|nr:beta-mannosidase-like [Chrysoperla carnea]
MYWFIPLLLLLLLNKPFIGEAGKIKTVSLIDNHEQERESLVQSLEGIWNVTNDNHSINIFCNVPGGIYSDLMDAGIIGDIYKNFNDLELRWIPRENWNYFTNFSVSKEILEKKAVFLVFNGIDTFATITLNGKEVGYTENMFRRYRYSVKDFLRIGNNNISVYIHSPIEVSIKEYEIETKRHDGIPVLPICLPDKYNGECHVNHIRKQQASFSWDWGPSFPSSGIWKLPVLETYDVVMIGDIEVHITRQSENKRWDVKLIAHLESFPNNTISGSLISKLSHYKNKTSFIVNETNIENYKIPNSGRIAITQNLIVPDDFVDLWWPNGYGQQILYDLNVSFNSSEHVSKSIKVGFRTIQLVEDAIENHEGATFYFKINDLPMFMKGSNWIPSNILPEATTSEAGEKRIRKLLTDANIANMNMLRVWGGGIYESDFFYSVADELGILIWQDFMFASSMYPASESFLSNVEEEIVQQVTRLQYHPSIALWAGNNENEGNLKHNQFGTADHYDLFKDDYIKLYADVIKTNIEKIDKTRPFVLSSPGNGKLSDEQGYIAEDPGSSKYGDVHDYPFWNNGWLPSSFPIPRFISEYGLQSLPNYQTLEEATDNPSTDLQYGSDFMEKRQHHPDNYGSLDFQLSTQFSDEKIDFKNYIFRSQIIQAVSMKVGTEKFRQFQNTIREDSAGLTMGALYWQLNDVWQAPSWSGIDFAGRWKMLHYYAKNFFAPILISGNVIDDLLTVFITSEVRNTIEASMSIIIHNYQLFKDINTISKNVSITPQNSSIYYQNEVKTLLGDNDLSDTIIILKLNIESQQHNLENFVLTGDLKKVTNVPHTTCTVTKKDGPDFQLRLKTDSYTPFVWLQTNITTGRFSDNGIIMTTKEKDVYFYGDNPDISIEAFQASIRVSSLRNTTQLI